MTHPIAREPDPIQLTPTQIDNYEVRPEFFTVRKYNEPIREPFHGQAKNDPDVAKRSNEALNRGSVGADQLARPRCQRSGD